jgi:hypothetical protein
LVPTDAHKATIAEAFTAILQETDGTGIMGIQSPPCFLNASKHKRRMEQAWSLHHDAGYYRQGALARRFTQK